MSDWPICTKCSQSILVHRLVGALAYCDPNVRTVETRSSFGYGEVNRVHRTLGHSVSHHAQDLERREHG